MTRAPVGQLKLFKRASMQQKVFDALADGPLSLRELAEKIGETPKRCGNTLSRMSLYPGSKFSFTVAHRDGVWFRT